LSPTAARLFTKTWSEPKPGNAPQENEDAFAMRVLSERGDQMLIALADGASATIHARAWAQALVASAEPKWLSLGDHELSARLDSVRDGFDASPRAPQPWYMERKSARDGSQATLLVLLLGPAGDDTGTEIQAVAVGDCNLIVLHNDGRTASFPVEASGQFKSAPELVSSRPQAGLRYCRWTTRISPGDWILACTDAVGQWMLACLEADRKDALIQVLRDLAGTSSREPAGPKRSSAGQAGILRKTLTGSAFRHPLREDDLTLIVCQPVSRAPGPPSQFREQVANAIDTIIAQFRRNPCSG
jgi:serine/threonine protein phosphatase PrpC